MRPKKEAKPNTANKHIVARKIPILIYIFYLNLHCKTRGKSGKIAEICIIIQIILYYWQRCGGVVPHQSHKLGALVQFQAALHFDSSRFVQLAQCRHKKIL